MVQVVDSTLFFWNIRLMMRGARLCVVVVVLLVHLTDASSFLNLSPDMMCLLTQARLKVARDGNPMSPLFKVGEGAFGDVWFDHSSGNVIKNFKHKDRAQALVDSRKEAADHQVIAAAILSNEGHCSDIVPQLRLDCSAHRFMAYSYAGEDLMHVKDRCVEPMSDCVVLEIGIQAAHALLCMHNRGWYHNDIKYDNIALDHKGKVRLLDLGQATEGNWYGMDEGDLLMSVMKCELLEFRKDSKLMKQLQDIDLPSDADASVAFLYNALLHIRHQLPAQSHGCLKDFARKHVKHPDHELYNPPDPMTDLVHACKSQVYSRAISEIGELEA